MGGPGGDRGLAGVRDERAVRAVPGPGGAADVRGGVLPVHVLHHVVVRLGSPSPASASTCVGGCAWGYLQTVCAVEQTPHAGCGVRSSTACREERELPFPRY